MTFCQTSVCGLELDGQNPSRKFPVGSQASQSGCDTVESEFVESVGNDAGIQSSQAWKHIHHDEKLEHECIASERTTLSVLFDL
jgi:hypothetical protein